MVAKKEQLKNKPKESVIRSRVDDETVDRLDYCTEKLETTRSSVIRMGIEKVYNELREK